MAPDRSTSPEPWPTLAQRRPHLVSLVVALTVTAGLAVLVLEPLLQPPAEGPPAPIAGAAVNITDPGRPTLTAALTATATPWPRRPRGGAAVAPPTDEPARPTATAAATATARPPARPLQTPTPTVEIARPTPSAALYLADADAGLDVWSGPNWSLADGALVNDGRGVDAAPWIVAPDSPSATGGYAVEAEIRVIGTASGYCEQNFGLVAIAADGRVYLGGGLLFTCDGEPPLARITDVTNWVDGYNRDRELSSTRLDLDPGWHTFRLEVSPDRVRLLIDGQVVAEATGPTAQGGGPTSAKVGLWSQGVQLAVRRVAIEPLAVG